MKIRLTEDDINENERIIPLTRDEASYIDAVRGQLGDGMWENSTSLRWSWMCNGIKENKLVMKRDAKEYNGKWLYNKLWGKSDSEVKEWFATKLKQVVKQWIKDEGNQDGWDRTNNAECDYLNNGQTVAGAYKVYDSLLGRADRSGNTVRKKITKRASQVEIGDEISKKKVAQIYQPLTNKDDIVTIIFDDNSVERINKNESVDIVIYKTIE